MKLLSVPTFSLFLLLGIMESSLSNALSAATLAQNLIVNGDAEAGSCDPIGDAVGSNIPAIPGWNSSNGFSVLCYNATGFEFVNNMGQTVRVSGLPSSTDPGPSDRGNNLFYGGAERASSNAFQIIDLTSLGASIDSSKLAYNLSGWLGGYGTDHDSTSLVATFLDEIGQSLGNGSITAPTPAQRNNSTGLFYQSVQGLIPLGTRQVNLRLDMNYLRGRVNDAYGDNLSFVVIPVPESQPFTLVSLGTVIGLGVFFKRQIIKSNRKTKN